MDPASLAVLEYGALGIVAMMVAIGARFAWRALDVFREVTTVLATEVRALRTEVSQLRTDALSHFDTASREIQELGESLMHQPDED